MTRITPSPTPTITPTSAITTTIDTEESIEIVHNDVKGDDDVFLQEKESNGQKEHESNKVNENEIQS